MNERRQQDTLPQEEYEAWLDSLEECEHGIHRDSGHVCYECLGEETDNAE